MHSFTTGDVSLPFCSVARTGLLILGVEECTYEERKQEQERLEQESGDVDTSVNPLTGKKYVYEYDRFYKFHINELKGNKDSGRGVVLGDKETDECFAGYKILEKEAIRSAKGTVRGVKNRVRAGIATFLQKPSSQVRIYSYVHRMILDFQNRGKFLLRAN